MSSSASSGCSRRSRNCRARLAWKSAGGFEKLGLDEIVSFTVPANRRSRAVMGRLGMHEDKAGAFEHPSIAPGSPLRLHCLYRLNRSRWKG